MPPIIQLNAYELGQIIALLPDVAWNRMDNNLRKKLKKCQDELTNSEVDLATLNLSPVTLSDEAAG